MPLTDLSKIQTHNILSYEIADKVFTFADEAEDMVRKWIGDAKYDEIAASTSHAYRSKVEKAESLLSHGLAIDTLNTRIAEKGGLIKSTGFAESTNTLMGKWESDSKARNKFARARQLLRKLLLKSVSRERPEYTTVGR